MYHKDSKIITIHWQDGAYLSGCKVVGEGAKLLEIIGAADFIPGWGYYVNMDLAHWLGREFTLGKATDFMKRHFDFGEGEKYMFVTFAEFIDNIDWEYRKLTQDERAACWEKAESEVHKKLDLKGIYLLTDYGYNIIDTTREDVIRDCKVNNKWDGIHLLCSMDGIFARTYEAEANKIKGINHEVVLEKEL